MHGTPSACRPSVARLRSERPSIRATEAAGMFTNPASEAAAAAPQYVRALLDLLGDRDPLEVQESLLDELRARLAEVDDATLRRPEREGKWSVIEVVQHLADTEIVYGYRLRMALSHDTPEIQGYDQDRWADRLRYAEQSLEDALEQLRVLRAGRLRLIRSLTPHEMRRYGIHAERGPESVDLSSRLLAAHDLLHLKQIDRILAAHAGGPAPASGQASR
jgi:hypothetical protein